MCLVNSEFLLKQKKTLIKKLRLRSSLRRIKWRHSLLGENPVVGYSARKYMYWRLQRTPTKSGYETRPDINCTCTSLEYFNAHCTGNRCIDVVQRHMLFNLNIHKMYAFYENTHYMERVKNVPFKVFFSDFQIARFLKHAFHTVHFWLLIINYFLYFWGKWFQCLSTYLTRSSI